MENAAVSSARGIQSKSASAPQQGGSPQINPFGAKSHSFRAQHLQKSQKALTEPLSDLKDISPSQQVDPCSQPDLAQASSSLFAPDSSPTKPASLALTQMFIKIKLEEAQPQTPPYTSAAQPGMDTTGYDLRDTEQAMTLILPHMSRRKLLVRQSDRHLSQHIRAHQCKRSACWFQSNKTLSLLMRLCCQGLFFR